MLPVRIAHISDLHISEHLLRPKDNAFYLPHRYGHDVQAFLALDGFLRNAEWDLLLITGDVSRIGNIQSFECVRNWLENEISFGEIHVGLNLSKRSDRSYLIIPGNHDRFNGRLRQSSLELYNREFPRVRPGSVKKLAIRNNIINVHFFDSTTSDGGFALGTIEQRSLGPKHLSDEEIDIALLHHHFLQPPKHPREAATELTNSADVAAYMLNAGFDGVFFGHTHKGYINKLSVDVLKCMLNDWRKAPRFFSRILPKWIMRNMEDDCLVSYKRESAKNGQLPTLDSYFNYIYLNRKGCKLKGPAEFANIRQFYDHMRNAEKNSSIQDELAKIKSRMILISLAPSACQAEAKWHGLHTVTFERDENGILNVSWDRYEFDGSSEFKQKPSDAHVA